MNSPIGVEHFVALVVIPNVETRMHLDFVTFLGLFLQSLSLNGTFKIHYALAFTRFISSLALWTDMSNPYI